MWRVARWLWDKILEPAYLKFLVVLAAFLEQSMWIKVPVIALLLDQGVAEPLFGASAGGLLAAIIGDLNADAALRRSLVE